MNLRARQRKETGEESEAGMDRLLERYLADPQQVSLEESRKIFHSFMGQVESGSEEAMILREEIKKIDQALESVGRGDPGYVITPEGTYRREAEMKTLPLDRLIADPGCQELFREMEGEDFEQLKDSIRELGIIEPIIVDPKMRVICGHQRLRAARALGLRSVPVVIRPVEKEETQAMISIEENIRRRQLQPSEVARAVKKLVELKEKKNRVKEVAKEIGFSKSQVYRYRDLSHLIPEISSLLDGGKLTQRTAVQIAQLDEEIQRVLYEAVGERINAQKVEEFKRANAELIGQAEKLTSMIERHKRKEAQLEEEMKRLQERVDKTEIKVIGEERAKIQLEEELQKTRAESYRELQKKQAVIDKFSRNLEPRVVPPPDYEAVKKELKALKARGTRPPEVIMAELYGILAGQVLTVDLAALKGKLTLSTREQLRPLIPKLEAWVTQMKQLVLEQARKR
ncbi:MAG: ParB/RepB/Spo0J family partition protein [Nitrospiria bacterium]